MLLMKVEICSLLFVCWWGGEGDQGDSLTFFFLLYRSFFVCPGNANVFSVVSSVRPNSDIWEPEPPKDFCDVIPFVLLACLGIWREF